MYDVFFCLRLFFPEKICDSCDANAKCVSDHCVCNEGYLGNGLICTLFCKYDDYILSKCITMVPPRLGIGLRLSLGLGLELMLGALGL